MKANGGHEARPLTFTAFDAETFPEGLTASSAVEYLRCYLADLGAATIIEEPSYFDRDYLAEFSAFYSTSSRGYSNSCRRLHLFSIGVDSAHAHFHAALAGETPALVELQRHYLGFVVIRPIHATPLGRTVLRWYPETRPEIPRVTRPAREYEVHLAGLTASADDGLALSFAEIVCREALELMLLPALTLGLLTRLEASQG